MDSLCLSFTKHSLIRVHYSQISSILFFLLAASTNFAICNPTSKPQTNNSSATHFSFREIDEENMLKQSPNRYQRTKGFNKVKQGFKIFILIAVGIWLLYQLKHSHDKKEAYEESSAKIFEKLKAAGHETKKLGRKGFQPWIEKPYELTDDTEESKPERIKEQSSGGDDDIVEHDRDRVEEEEPEEVEDLIDEEDKEKEEENEDEDGEDIGKQIEDMNLLEDQDHNAGEKDTKATSEKHYKENGASRVAMRGTQSIGTEFEFEFGGLRKIKEEEVENLEKIGTEKQQKKIMDPSKVVVPSTDSSPKVVDSVTIERGSFPNVLLVKRKVDVLDFADSGGGSTSDSLLNREFD